MKLNIYLIIECIAIYYNIQYITNIAYFNLRIINLYFPGAIFTVKDIDSNSRTIKYNGEILGYLVGNVYRGD